MRSVLVAGLVAGTLAGHAHRAHACTCALPDLLYPRDQAADVPLDAVLVVPETPMADPPDVALARADDGQPVALTPADHGRWRALAPAAPLAANTTKGTVLSKLSWPGQVGDFASSARDGLKLRRLRAATTRTSGAACG